MTLVATLPKENRLALRVAVSLFALALAAALVFGLGYLVVGAVPAAPKQPFRRRHPRGGARRLRLRPLARWPSRSGSTAAWRTG